MKTVKCIVPSCEEMLEVEKTQLRLFPDFHICPKHMEAAICWGIQRWIEAGAPE